jgi:hypothetical protein
MRWWGRQVGRHVGDFQARVVLTLFYWLVAVPFALVVRLLDPLRLRAGGDSAWVRRSVPAARALDAARRQY